MAVWQELAGELKTMAGSALNVSRLRTRGVEQQREAVASEAASRARTEAKAREGAARGEAVAARFIDEKKVEQGRAERFADRVESGASDHQPDVPGTPKNPG